MTAMDITDKAVSLDFISTIRDKTNLSDYLEVKNLMTEIAKIEKAGPFRATLLFKLGVIQGQRMERARRRKVASSKAVQA